MKNWGQIVVLLKNPIKKQPLLAFQKIVNFHLSQFKNYFDAFLAHKKHQKSPHM